MITSRRVRPPTDRHDGPPDSRRPRPARSWGDIPIDRPGVAFPDARPARPALRATPEARWLGVTAVAFALTGVLIEAPILALMAAFPLTFIAWCLVVALVMRHRLSPGSSEPARARVDLTPSAPPLDAIKIWEGRTFELRAELATARGIALHGIELLPVLGESLAVTTTPAADGTRLTLEVVPLRLGSAHVHGFELRALVAWRMFRLEAWLPARLELLVLPRHLADPGRAPLTPTRAALEERSDLVHRLHRGFGVEIRELRDFHPGDPFKHIAWRASARRGKLIAREFESDLSLSIWLMVDASPSMFWGAPGEARIDHALELAHDLARTLTAGRDRVGLVVHDHAVRLVVEPDVGPLQFTRILQALLEVPHLVHEDRTELTDRELVDRVGQWFESQEGRSFALPAPAPRGPRQLAWDEARLVGACQNALDRRLERRRPIVPLEAYAVDPKRSVLRAFARWSGIPLPRDPTPRPGGQAHGLEAVLEALLMTQGRAKSGSHLLMPISDLHTADDLDALRRVALAARRHRHGIVFAIPTGDRNLVKDMTTRDPRLLRALVEVSALRAAQSLRTAEAVLRPAGATFVTVRPDDPLPRVLARLRQMA
ncbi:MAG: DUF58 domain-containing protein [Deltaproteobacteria bacterium]|nr:DUF58 domain-containing protein [Deltaproteobacteria bacterium]